MTYSEFRCYSPLRDCLVSRISMADERGQEFWIEVTSEGKQYRKEKEQALDDLQAAIAAGLAPGHVIVSPA